MKTRILPPLAATLLGFGLVSCASASCFDAPLLITRYHFPNPAAVTPNWQDIYAWTPGQASARLSTGAFPATERDHGGIIPLPSGELLFMHSAAGITDPRIARMSALDSDGDMQGDAWSELAAGPFDSTAPALRAGHYVTTILDAAGDGQIGHATYANGDLSAFTALTSDDTYPDSYTFVSDTLFLHDVDGDGLSFFDLATNVQTAAALSLPFARQPTAPANGAQVVFSALVGISLDLFIADVGPGPVLSNVTALVTTPQRTEGAAQFNADGSCLAWISTPNTDVDGNPIVGPYSDIVIMEMSTGTQMQMTTSRDIGAVHWQ